MADSETLGAKQKLIGLQIAVSVPLQLVFLWFGYRYFGFAGPAADTVSDRLAFAIGWQMLGALTLLAMIGFIAGARPTSNDVIDGNDKAPRLEVQVRVQRNTVEQLLLMVVAHLALATLLPFAALKIIPVLACLFVISRMVYWIGYSINPLYRTLGFVATFYPNIGALLYAAYLFWT